MIRSVPATPPPTQQPYSPSLGHVTLSSLDKQLSCGVPMNQNTTPGIEMFKDNGYVRNSDWICSVPIVMGMHHVCFTKLLLVLTLSGSFYW